MRYHGPVIAASHKVAGLGEMLWDLIPGQKHLGGAPCNFAFIASLLGDQAIIASRLGLDPLGREAALRSQQLGLDTQYLQFDEHHPTGTVEVNLDPAGQASYDIAENPAWDHLQWTAGWRELAASADAVCYGSLAQRSPQSRATIAEFLQATKPDCLRIFDVNLRTPHYSAEVLQESLRMATVLKMNQAELPEVMGLLGLTAPGEVPAARKLRQTFNLQAVCITRGARGSLLVTREELSEHRGIAAALVDTVGSGDAFTAAMTHYLLRKAPPAAVNEAANRWGSWVASCAGATPRPTGDELAELLRI